jgi:hypothetical protein
MKDLKEAEQLLFKNICQNVVELNIKKKFYCKGSNITIEELDKQITSYLEKNEANMMNDIMKKMLDIV